MLKLIKKLWFYLNGFLNDLSEKHSDPALELRQVAREIEEERNKRRRQFIDAHTRISSLEDSLTEKKSLYEQARSAAKKYKESSEDDKAIRYAERCVQIKDWIVRIEADVERGRKHLAALKDDVEELDFQRQQVELEASIAESTMDISQTDIKRHSSSGIGKNYDDIIKDARVKVKHVQLSADSHRVAFETFDQTEESRTSSEEAKKFLESI